MRWGWTALVALGACGCGGGPGDGVPADAPPYVVPPDAAPCTAGPITVIVESPYKDRLLFGVDVVASDPAGGFIAHVLTDAKGTAVLDVPPGSSITVVRDEPGDYIDIATIFDARCGDVLEFGAIPLVYLDQPGDEVMTVDLAPYAGGGTYAAHNGCNSVFFTSELQGQIRSVPTCSLGPHDYLASAVGAGGVLLATAVVEDQAFVGGGTVVVPDNWTTPSDIDVMVTGMPPATYNLSVYYDGVKDGLLYPSLREVGTPSPGTDETVTVQSPSFGETARLRAAVFGVSFSTYLGAQDIITVGEDHAFDVSDFLPLIDSSEFVAETREVRWTTAGFGMRPPDGAYGLLSFDVGDTGYKWRAIGPATGSWTLPVLPPDLDPGDFEPLGRVNVTLYESSELADYHAFRATADRDVEIRRTMRGLAARQRVSTN